MKRAKITAVVLSLAFLLSVVSANKSHKVYADEVEQTVQAEETEATETEATETEATEVTEANVAETEATQTEAAEAEALEVEEEVVSQEAADAAAIGLPIDAERFPDLHFRAYVSTFFDKDQNGFLSDAELSQVDVIDIDFHQLTSLQGIEYFPNLKILNCKHNKLTSIDLSNNTKLEELSCSYNYLTYLDVSNNLELKSLDVSNNSLTSLDISHHENLIYIYCNDNVITDLNMDFCTSFRFLDIRNNDFKNLDISTCNINERYYMITMNGELNLIKECYHEGTVVVDPAVAPTETQTGLTEGSHCSHCGAVIVAQQEIPALPHTEVATVDMYRLYNPNSGEHFFTSSTGERDSLVAAGWSNEGIGWKAPVSSNTPVYRLYNQNGGEHHYTTSASERDFLVSNGWSDEGIGWYSDDAHGVPVYRQYNPNSFSNNHNYSTSASENDWLVSIGWQSEGIAWYGVA